MRRAVLLVMLVAGLTLAGCGDDSATTTDGTVAVPEVTGQNLDYARGALAAVGLVADVVTVEATGTPADRVVGQVPAAGTRVAPGSAVVIKVAAGGTVTTVPSTGTTAGASTTTAATITTTTHATTTTTAPLPVMPDVVCWNLQDAQNEIQRAGVFWSESRDATGAGRMQLIDSNWLVVDQEPAPGTAIGERDPLLLVVKYGEPNPCGA